MKPLNSSLTIVFLACILSLPSCSTVSTPEAQTTTAPSNAKLNAEEEQPEWAREVPRKAISTPYSFCEKLVWIKNLMFGPSDQYKELSQFIPQTTTLNQITPKLTLGFFGDIMQLKDKNLEFGEDLKQFFTEADYLVGNFEGVISSEEGVLLASTHTQQVLLALKRLFPPERTILTNANNHSCDFGWAEFNKSYQLQKDQGFLAIGRKDEPSITLIDGVSLTNVTKWSNQPCTHIATFADIDAGYNSEAFFNILSPHWGYEQQMYPNPVQIQTGVGLLNKWDMIIGHHSHCPQVISSYEVNNSKRLLAYSLGDFCTFLEIDKYDYGIVVKVEIGPDSEGKWHVGKVDWRFSQVNHIDKNTIMVNLTEECKYFDLPTQ